MGIRSRRTAAFCSAACLTIGLIGLARTTPAHAADLREFVHETQQSTMESGQLSLVWWIPPEYWEVSLDGRSEVPPKTAADIRAAFRDYQVFALVRAKAGVQGLTALQSKEELVKNARFEVGGKAIPPVAPEKLPTGVQTMLGALKPMLGGMLGQLGQSMELVVYPGIQDKQKLVDPMKPGSFQFILYDQTYRWRTPLGSLLPKKVDPKTGEEFPGNYEYNPYTGQKIGAK
jgi:hypothetical protein